jgi:hypothetical protein
MPAETSRPSGCWRKTVLIVSASRGDATRRPLSHGGVDAIVEERARTTTSARLPVVTAGIRP